MKREPWENAEVKRVHLLAEEGGEPVHYGGGFVSDVYMGRLKLNAEDGKRKNLRVAVKVFKDQDWIREKHGEYAQAMRDLRAAGLPLPKMFIHRLSEEDAEGFHGKAKAGDFVKVMELYGSKAGSKLDRELAYSPEVNKRIVEYSTKLANAGYAPEVEDLYNTLRGGIKPMDLDMLVVCGCKPPLEERAQGVLDHIKSLVRNGHSEHDGLLREAFKHAQPELKERLKALTANPEWKEEGY